MTLSLDAFGRGVLRVVGAAMAAFVWSMWHMMLDGEPSRSGVIELVELLEDAGGCRCRLVALVCGMAHVSRGRGDRLPRESPPSGMSDYLPARVAVHGGEQVRASSTRKGSGGPPGGGIMPSSMDSESLRNVNCQSGIGPSPDWTTPRFQHLETGLWSDTALLSAVWTFA